MKDPAKAVVASARRRGGPLDTTMITTRCLKCGHEVTKKLRWFDGKSKFPCPRCDGDLDATPLRDATLATVKSLQRALKAKYGDA
jgi:hypothetical protein